MGWLSRWEKYCTEKNGAYLFTLWDQEEGAKYDEQVRCESHLST